MSIKGPWFDHGMNVSLNAVAATVQTEGSDAGEVSLASSPLFPAETARKMPAETMAAA